MVRSEKDSTEPMSGAADQQDPATQARARSGPGRVAAWVLNFLKFGANTNPLDPRVPFYRHALIVRITHWLNAGILLVMLMSGLQIFNATPALYWGKQSNFAHPLVFFGAMQNADGDIVKGITQIGPWRFDTTGFLGASRVDGVLAARAFRTGQRCPGRNGSRWGGYGISSSPGCW